MASSWERLAFVTQASDASTFSVTFTAKEHLRVVFHGFQSTPVEPDIRFNDDDDDNYAGRLSINGTGYLMTYDDNDRIYNYGYSPSGTGEAITNMEIINVLNEEKMVLIDNNMGSVGAGNVPTRRENTSKWANTSEQVTKITFVDLGSGALIKAGSTITVWGADDQSSTPFYPNISNGAIFEESDTGKHYMFDGTSTWNEMS